VVRIGVVPLIHLLISRLHHNLTGNTLCYIFLITVSIFSNFNQQLDLRNFIFYCKNACGTF
jgi:hypothetical protein